MSFKRDFRKGQARVTGEMAAKIEEASVELFSRIIMASPVDTGAFKGNWQTGFDEVPSGPIDRKDKTGAAAIAEARREAGRFQITGKLYLVNSLPYASRIEHGWSQQAPTGLVAVNVNSMKEILRRGR